MNEKKQQTAYPLRMPKETRQLLENSAKAGGRSLHAEIIQRLQATIDLDELMAEMQTGTYADVGEMLESVLADNNLMTARGEQTFGTAYSMLDRLLDEKLAPIRETLLEVKSYEKRGDKPSPTTKKPIRKTSRPLGMEQDEWEARRAASREPRDE
ncbi:MAG TPA: hypothetical protein DCG67_05630 [Pseudomonas sp.]|uniref:Arc family DNA-binding protein n=1 Tax=Stutzerimonas balearica TaxID=74829 RepID=UPI000C622889|nr:hypothetical protein [Phycisphaerae bacterium]HAF91226.1 hypothetical protein [Pseudomonas sp.]